MTDALASKHVDPKSILHGTAPTSDHSEGMSYLNSIPRRLVTLYLPLSIFLIVLLFPFYWMALTAIKPNEQLLDMDRVNPFWTWSPTFQHISKLLFEIELSALALEHDVCRGRRDHLVDHRQRARRLCDGAAALQGSADDRRAIFLAYLVPPSILFIPLSTVIYNYGLFDSAARSHPRLSDDPDPVLDLASDGLFQDHPLSSSRNAR